MLPATARRAGIEFRPQVIWNAATATAVMWYEDRWSSGTNRGYAVATAPSPAGPYTTVVESTTTHGAGRVGDYDLFVDTDGSAYHVRTGVVVERLNASYTGTTGAFAAFNNGGVEGPSMFVRRGTYYITLGVGCCALRCSRRCCRSPRRWWRGPGRGQEGGEEGGGGRRDGLRTVRLSNMSACVCSHFLLA